MFNLVVSCGAPRRFCKSECFYFSLKCLKYSNCFSFCLISGSFPHRVPSFTFLGLLFLGPEIDPGHGPLWGGVIFWKKNQNLFLKYFFRIFGENFMLLAWEMAELWQLVPKRTLLSSSIIYLSYMSYYVLNWKYSPTQLKLVELANSSRYAYIILIIPWVLMHF